MTLNVKSQVMLLTFMNLILAYVQVMSLKLWLLSTLGLVWVSIEGELLFVGEANQQKVGLKMNGTETAYPSIRQTN